MAARVLKQTYYLRNSAGCGFVVGPMNCRFVMKRPSIFTVEPYRNANPGNGVFRPLSREEGAQFWRTGGEGKWPWEKRYSVAAVYERRQNHEVP